MIKTFSLAIILAVFSLPSCKKTSQSYHEVEVHFNDGSIDTLVVKARHRLAYECLEEEMYPGSEHYNCLARNVRYVKRIVE